VISSREYNLYKDDEKQPDTARDLRGWFSLDKDGETHPVIVREPDGMFLLREWNLLKDGKQNLIL
jgi:hypothetical protein